MTNEAPFTPEQEARIRWLISDEFEQAMRRGAPELYARYVRETAGDEEA